MSNKIILDNFDTNSLLNHSNKYKLNPKIAIIGNIGKSFMIKDLMYHMKEIPVGIVISPTNKLTKFYDNFISNEFIHNEYDNHIISNLLNRQRHILTKKK